MLRMGFVQTKDMMERQSQLEQSLMRSNPLARMNQFDAPSLQATAAWSCHALNMQRESPTYHARSMQHEVAHAPMRCTNELQIRSNLALQHRCPQPCINALSQATPRTGWDPSGWRSVAMAVASGALCKQCKLHVATCMSPTSQFLNSKICHEALREDL